MKINKTWRRDAIPPYFLIEVMTPLQKGQCTIFVRRKWEKVGKKASNFCNLLMKTPKNAIKVGDYYSQFLKIE